MITNYFIGVVSKIIDPDLYKIEVDIPEQNMGLIAFPKRGEVDEPRVGDVVVLQEFDPTYHSYYLYEKLKENNFIGIRSRGKILKMSADEISIGIFDPSDESWYDTNDGVDNTPPPTSWIKIDSTGNIDINAEGSNKIHITGDSEVTIDGSSTVNITGDSNINVNGKTTVTSPDVTITGGKLTVNGSVSPTGSGPFCGIPVCPFSGAPHIGPIVTGT